MLNPQTAIWLNASLLSLALVGAASAETAAAPKTESAATPAGLEEIIVTAQRRSERQQDVPIAVTTFTASALANAGVGSTEALLEVTPGLVMNRQLAGATPFIRGVGSQSVAAGVESPVATYVDGVYYLSNYGTIFSFNNIEQVEVLKGPQGTLFGRNANGGMINVTTRDPKVEPRLQGSVGYSNYNTVQGAFYATGGIGNLAADISAFSIHQGDGYGKNLVLNEDVNRERETGVRSKVLWTPTQNDRITFSADFSNTQTDLGIILNPLPGTVPLGVALAPLFGIKVPKNVGPYDSIANRPQSVNTDHWGTSLHVEHNLGWANFSSLSAYRHLKDKTRFDQDASPTNIVDVTLNQTDRSVQQEFLLVGSADNLSWTTGAFLLDSKSAYDPLAILSSVIPPLNYNSFATLKTRSYAGFGQGTYSVTPTTKVTAGVRYTVDKRSFDAANSAVAGSPAGAGTVLVAGTGQKNFPKVTWRFAVDQRLGEDVLAYISYSRGFKSGVFATSAVTPTPQPIRPETLDALEIGLKSEMFDRRLRFNAAVYSYKYKDIQLNRIENGASTLLNASKGKVYGAEFETTFVPHLTAGNLVLNANLALLNAKYDEFPDGPAFQPNVVNGTPVGGNSLVTRDLTGNKMIRSPDWTASIGGDYSIPLGAGTATFSANYFHSASFFWEPDNRTRQGAYNLVNGRISYAFGAKEQYRVRVFGKNLTNQLYQTFVTSNALGDQRGPAAPRTYGIGLDFDF